MYNGTHDNNRGKRLINYHRDMRFVIAKEELEFICCQMWDRLLMEYQEQLEVTIRIRR